MALDDEPDAFSGALHKMSGYLPSQLTVDGTAAETVV
jgi:hypothetical protein